MYLGHNGIAILYTSRACPVQIFGRARTNVRRGGGRDLTGVDPGADADGWRELADMYLEQQHVEHARKALEEVFLLDSLSREPHLPPICTLGRFSGLNRHLCACIDG